MRQTQARQPAEELAAGEHHARSARSRLLSLPREVGMHPSENEMILAGLGRYGPYLQMGKMYANLPGIEDVLEIQMNRAVAVIDEKKAGGGKGRFGRAAPAPLKELGESPVTGKPVRVLTGRYGPYINDGEINANVPRDKKPEDVTLDEALCAAGGARGGWRGEEESARKRAEEGSDEAKPREARRAKKASAKKATAQESRAKGRRLASLLLLRRRRWREAAR